MGGGFFSPSPAAKSLLPDTPHLLVAGFALAITAAKAFRLATREVGRRDTIEAGLLLVLLVAILEQASGGPASWSAPLQYLVIALLAAHSEMLAGVAFALFAAALAAAPQVLAGTAGLPLAGHTLALLSFAVAVGSFLRIERRSRLDADRRFARLKGDTDALAEDTDDVDDLKAQGSLTRQDRERRLRDLKNELDAQVHRAIETARTALAAHSVVYLRLDGESLRMSDAASLEEGDVLREEAFDARQGFIAGAIKGKQPIIVGDLAGMSIPWYSRAVEVRSAAIVPLVRAGWVTGLIVADHREPDRFGKTHAEVLAGLGNTIADLEHGGRERERHAKFQEHLRHLVEVSKAMQGSLAPDELASRALMLARNLAEFDFAVIAVAAGPEGERFTITTAMGTDHGRLTGKDAPTSETLIGWVLRNRVYLKAEHFKWRTVKTPLLGKRLDPDGVRAALVFPMLGRENDSVVGAVVFGSTTRDTFTHDEFEMLESVVGQASLAMSNAVLYKRTEELATTDGLTGLYNRRHLTETLTREMERAQRNPSTRFALVISDIDHFKKVNDTYGHPMGDEVLRRVGKILKSHIQRKTDLVARYGGEEFVLILADTNAENARAVIDKIRAAVAKEVFESEGRTFRVTMSAGVAAYPDDIGIQPGTPATVLKETLVERADRALYFSKESGRNRSTLWTAIASGEPTVTAVPAR